MPVSVRVGKCVQVGFQQGRGGPLPVCVLVCVWVCAGLWMAVRALVVGMVFWVLRVLGCSLFGLSASSRWLEFYVCALLGLSRSRAIVLACPFLPL